MENKNQKFQTIGIEYLDLLEQLGIKDEDTSEYKNRGHRRFNFNSAEKPILLRIGNDMCGFNDVSIEGMSFFPMNKYGIGQQLGVNFDGRFNVDAVIVNAIQDKSRSSDGDVFFRYGAKFILVCEGLNFTLSILKYYLENEKIKFNLFPCDLKTVEAMTR